MRQLLPLNVAVYIILERNNELLLLKRQNTGYRDGEYTVPSGHKESGETPLQAAIRELQEETGLVVTEDCLEHVHTLYRFDATDKKDYIDFFFHCTNFFGEPVNTELHKCSDLRWFPVNNLPLELFDYIREVLEFVAKGTRYSERIRL